MIIGRNKSPIAVILAQQRHRQSPKNSDRLEMKQLLSLVFTGCCMMAMVHGFLPKISARKTSLSSSSSSSNSARSLATTTVEKTEEEWRELLTPEQFYVLREEGTEAPNSSELNFVTEDGSFTCAGCGAPLFTTLTKFDSGTGWPSFYAPIDANAVQLSTDFKLILPRTECSCKACGGHLGHVFQDGPEPTGQRFCMNGIAMEFSSLEENAELAKTVTERQEATPYQISTGQVLPSILINGVMGGLFFNSFLVRMESGLSSPLDVFPLLPAIYFGVATANSLGRLLTPK